MRRRRRRLARILLNVAAAASLLLCGTTAILWVKSYRMTELLWGGGDDASSFAASGAGEFAVYIRWGAGGLSLPEKWRRDATWKGYPASEFMIQGGRTWSVMGATASLNRIGPPPRDTVLCAVIPYWLCFCLVAALPLAVGVTKLRRCRKAPGTCAGWGYDLRATPGRCPECGRVGGPGA